MTVVGGEQSHYVEDKGVGSLGLVHGWPGLWDGGGVGESWGPALDAVQQPDESALVGSRKERLWAVWAVQAVQAGRAGDAVGAVDDAASGAGIDVGVVPFGCLGRHGGGSGYFREAGRSFRGLDLRCGHWRGSWSASRPPNGRSPERQTAP